MKRIFILSIAILLAISSFSKTNPTWDKIGNRCGFTYKSDGYMYSSNKTFADLCGTYKIIDFSNESGRATVIINDKGNEKTINLDNISNYYKYSLNSMEITFNSPQKEVVIPEVIYKNYMIGDRCFKTGFVFLSFGFLSSVIGICTMKESPTISTAMYAVGGTCFSVSLPLICFGDHIKRECNMNYELWENPK